jgi:hypothetical protein
LSASKLARGSLKLASDHLRNLAQRYTAAWCSQDPTSVAAFFSPNGSLRVNDDPPAVGRGAITEVARDFMTAFPDMRVRMDGLQVQDAGTVNRWTLTGTNTGPGVRATGSAPADLRNGRLARTGSSRSRKAISMLPSINVNWNAA